MLALVVDDSRMARYVLSKMLKEQNINVDEVESGEEALGYLCNSNPDMIFMDHNMPGMDGFQVLRAIKNDPNTAPIPILMYTSKEGEVYMNKARQLGAIEVLPKQLKSEHLVSVLDKLELLPDGSPADTSVETAKPEDDAPVFNASDVGGDIEQITKDAEASLSSQALTQQVKQMLEEHYDAFSKHVDHDYHTLATSVHEKIDALDEKLSSSLTSLPTVTPEAPKRSVWKTLLTVGTIGVMAIGTAKYIGKKTEIASLQAELDVLKRSNPNLSRLSRNTAASLKPGSGATQGDIEKELEGLMRDQETKTKEWLTSFQWAINQDMSYAWNKEPFNAQLAERLSTIASRLDKVGFTGTLALTSHLGNYCVVTNPNGQTFLPSASDILSNCVINILPPQQEEVIGLEKSAKFENFMTDFNERYEGKIRLSFNTEGHQSPRKRYPVQESDTLASEWNRIADQNQRVVIELQPTP